MMSQLCVYTFSEMLYPSLCYKMMFTTFWFYRLLLPCLRSRYDLAYLDYLI